MLDLPRRNWCSPENDHVMNEKFGQLLRKYEEALRAQFRTLTFTHDLRIEEDECFKVGEAAFLSDGPHGYSYGCFWLAHQDPHHCHFKLIPCCIDVIPKLLTLKRAVVQIYENAGLQVVPVPKDQDGNPENKTTAWLVDVEEGQKFCMKIHRGLGFELNDPITQRLDEQTIELSSSGLLLDEGSDYKTFSLEGFVPHWELFEYSFPPDEVKSSS